MKVRKEIMDGSKIWTSPSKVSELTSKLNWRIQIKYINMLTITISIHMVVIEGLVPKNQQKAT